MRQAVRVGNTVKHSRQALRHRCIELARQLQAQQRPLGLEAFLATLLHPLCGPLLKGFGQHRPYLLKPRERPGHRPAEAAATPCVR